MSLRNFSRAFAREFGSTPAKFVTKMRVETAKRLLIDSERSLEKIAAECGFGSVDSMQRARFAKKQANLPAPFAGNARADFAITSATERDGLEIWHPYALLHYLKKPVDSLTLDPTSGSLRFG